MYVIFLNGVLGIVFSGQMNGNDYVSNTLVIFSMEMDYGIGGALLSVENPYLN